MASVADKAYSFKAVASAVSDIQWCVCVCVCVCGGGECRECGLGIHIHHVPRVLAVRGFSLKPQP